MRASEHRLLTATLERLKNFENDTSNRLARLEENLRLLRQDLVGDGQPGRILRLEEEVDRVRAAQQQQRGMLAALSFIISAAVAFLAHLFDHP
ncbi:MAG: hypothetical protein K6U09_06820 [Acidobacteriia bacterium]|jgi:hypothetical protein|nr:hypothetical protein [Terriglobia bacterium]